MARLFTTLCTNYFKPTVETYCSEKNLPFKVLLLTEDGPGHPRALMEVDDELNVVFLPASAACPLQPVVPGVS